MSKSRSKQRRRPQPALNPDRSDEDNARATLSPIVPSSTVSGTQKMLREDRQEGQRWLRMFKTLGHARHLRHAWRGIEAVAVLFSFVAFFFLLRPTLAVVSDDSLNEEQPFATPFKFTNNGVLSLQELRFNLVINTRSLRTEEGGELRLLPMPVISELNPGDSVTEFIPITFGEGGPEVPMRIMGSPSPIDLKILSRFRIQLWPFEITKAFRFVTLRDNSGRLRWFQVPANDSIKWVDTR